MSNSKRTSVRVARSKIARFLMQEVSLSKISAQVKVAVGVWPKITVVAKWICGAVGAVAIPSSLILSSTYMWLPATLAIACCLLCLAAFVGDKGFAWLSHADRATFVVFETPGVQVDRDGTVHTQITLKNVGPYKIDFQNIKSVLKIANRSDEAPALDSAVECLPLKKETLSFKNRGSWAGEASWQTTSDVAWELHIYAGDTHLHRFDGVSRK